MSKVEFDNPESIRERERVCVFERKIKVPPALGLDKMFLAVVPYGDREFSDGSGPTKQEISLKSSIHGNSMFRS